MTSPSQPIARAKRRQAARAIALLIKPAEVRYVRALRGVMRAVHNEYRTRIDRQLPDLVRTDAKTPDGPKVSAKGPKEGTFAEVTHYYRSGDVGVFRYKTQQHYIKAAGPRGQAMAEELLQASRISHYAHSDPPERASFSYTAAREGDKWTHVTDVPELGAKAGEPVAVLNKAPSAASSPAPSQTLANHPQHAMLHRELDALGVHVQVAIPHTVGPLFDRMSKQVQAASAKGQALYGITVKAAGVSEAVAKARDANIKLVENAARVYAADVRKVMGDESNFSLRVEDIKAKLIERGDVSESRAELIARDQTLKLNGAITQARQTAAGVDSYVWCTSEDERVRDEHAALEGETFAWSSPPEPGHPGEDFQCRCVALPVIAELDDLYE